eukprot:COSAG02_NODE_2710_length_8187_cov_3.257295_4_plen_69_part_00
MTRGAGVANAVVLTASTASSRFIVYTLLSTFQCRSPPRNTLHSVALPVRPSKHVPPPQCAINNYTVHD